MKKIIKLTSILLATNLILTACSKEENKQNNNTATNSTSENISNKKEAYNFTVKDIDGNDVKLSDFKGKKVYINMWASWCGPCLKEIPELEKVYQEFKNNDNFVFLSITSPSDSAFENINAADETKSVIINKAKELNISYPVLFDFKDRFMINYSVKAFPTHIFINSDGTLESVTAGMLNYKNLKEKIETLK